MSVITMIKFIDNLLDIIISKNMVWLIFVITFCQFVVSSEEWTLKYYLMFMFGFMILVLSLMVCVWTLEIFFKPSVKEYMIDKKKRQREEFGRKAFLLECNSQKEARKE